jgi:hypothetical protein
MTVTYDLMHLAFRADISRVFTFAVGREGSSRSYRRSAIAKYATLTTYHVVKLAEFIEKLKTTADGEPPAVVRRHGECGGYADRPQHGKAASVHPF